MKELITMYFIFGFLFFILLAILFKFVKECDFEGMPVVSSIFLIVACFFLFNKSTSMMAVITLGITFLINAIFAFNESKRAQSIPLILIFFSVVGWVILLPYLVLGTHGNELSGLECTFFALCVVAPVLLIIWFFIVFLFWDLRTDIESINSKDNIFFKGE